MAAKTVAIVMQKGGVGKSTTALELAACLTHIGLRALLIDLDSQTNTTYCTAIEGYKHDIYELLTESKNITAAEALVHSQYHGDIIPGAKNMVNIESGHVSVSPLRLYSIIQELKGNYDYILIDTHPGLGAEMVLALAAADEVLVPVVPEPFAVQGLVDLNEILQQVKEKISPSLKTMGVLLIKYSDRLNLHKQVRGMINGYVGQIGSTLFKTTIRNSTKVGEAQGNRLPLHKYAPKEGVTNDYFFLTEEFINKA